jgi:LysR family hydrogen peroxide-inducible transcriptional activator
LKKKENKNITLHYEAGSIETLINLVDRDNGITILPKLATLKLTSSQKNKLREYAAPKPAREISLVTSENFPRKKLLNFLKVEIISSVKDYVSNDKKGAKILATDNTN